jgi:phosphoglycolate phosphatase-like HAD superfamily hydrolase
MARLVESGYAVVETNHVAAVRTGQIKAQYPLADAVSAAENGQLLVVDDVAKEVRFPADATEAAWLHASEERLYEAHLGREAFILESPNYPRMMKLAVGDIFETNAVELGETYADVAAAKAAGAIGVPSANGDILLAQPSVDDSEGIVLKIVEAVTLPNGQAGVKFAVAKA